MKYTSSEANKLLKKLSHDYNDVLAVEWESKTFLAATGEDPESVRPAYDYRKTQDELQMLSKKIRIVKHAINVFNTTTKVPGFDMTVDEMLVFLPQLSERANTLGSMRKELPKVREKTYGQGTNATIDYRYINYNLEAVKQDYEKVRDLLDKAQTALDTLNNSATFEIDI